MLAGDTTLTKYTASYESGFGSNKKVLEDSNTKTDTMANFSHHSGTLIDEMRLSEHLSIKKMKNRRLR